MMTSQRTLPFLLASFSVLLLSSAAQADTPTLLWTFQGGENIVCLEPISDIDGDGLPDIVFESYDAGCTLPDHLFCIRGASAGTGEAIWGAWPPGGVSNGGGWGDNCLRVSPDITGDGIEDVLLGTAWGGRSAYVLDGTNGDNIWWIFDTYSESPPAPPTSGWVYAIDDVPDFTGDGVPEVTFCAGSYNYSVYMADGASGSIVWSYQYTAPFAEVRCVGDVDGDGFADVCAGVSDQNYRLLCLSGPGLSGNPVFHWSLPYTGTIWTLIPCPSVDADALPEVVAGCWDGIVRCHDGATGAMHWTSDDFGYIVQRIDLVGDVNGNGHPDIIVGLWDNRVVMLEGLTGATLWTQWAGTLNGGDCWAVDGTDDLNADGVPDVDTVRGTPDLNGNGTPDFVAGTQMLTSGAGGIVYAFDGPGSAAIEDAVADAVPGLHCWPNPIRSGTDDLVFRAAPRDAGQVRVELIGAEGRIVRELCARSQTAARETSGTWDARDAGGNPIAPGVYWLRATLDGESFASERLVVVR
jgi:hypothetical protein